MKTNSNSLLILFALSLFLSCAWTPQRLVSEQPVVPIKGVVPENVKDSVVRIVGLLGTQLHKGSGFFIAPDKIAKNIHVVAHLRPVFAKLVDKETIWEVEGVTAYDVENDLVILKIAGEGLPLPLGDSDAVRRGEPISVVGFPEGVYKVMTGTVLGTRESDKRIRTTADTAGGSSGGPLLNNKGQVIGIHAGRDEAIPANVLKGLLSQTAPMEPLAQWNKRKPIRAYAYFFLGKTKFTNKNYDAALADFDKTIQLNPKLGHAYYIRGAAKSALRDYNGAITDYNKYIQMNLGDAEAYTDRALAKFRLGDSKAEQGNTEKARRLYKAAIEDYTSAINLDPNRHRVYNYSAWRKYLFGQFETDAGNRTEARKLYQGAINDSDQVIQRDPYNAAAYHTRGTAKIALGDAKGAIADFDELIRIFPESAKAYYELGRAKEALGQKEAAKIDFEKAKELDPNVGQ